MLRLTFVRFTYIYIYICIFLYLIHNLIRVSRQTEAFNLWQLRCKKGVSDLAIPHPDPSCGSRCCTQWAAMEDFIGEAPEGWMKGNVVIFLQPPFLWCFQGCIFFIFFREKAMTSWCFHMRGLSSCLLSYWYTEYVLNHHIAIFAAWFFVELRVKIIPVSQSILFSELQNSWSEQGFGARQMNSPVLNIPSKEKNFWRWRALWLFFGRYQASFKGIPSPFLSKDYLRGSFQEVLKLVIQLPLTILVSENGP